MDRGSLGGGPSSVRRDGAGELSLRIVQVAQTRYPGFTSFSPDAEAHSRLANGVIIMLTLLGHPFRRTDASYTARLAALLWLLPIQCLSPFQGFVTGTTSCFSFSPSFSLFSITERLMHLLHTIKQATVPSAISSQRPVA
ncbi:hypothetical protein LCI18_009046 [Fusarium solani-melongenae]|uniref:Uncharacterized protein n=1 Tax=Fusarium solani subsp. cucurbitae TaxID=2747967 RepID=A0ACD3ZA84_FUSSC|nr:hypothetical protein LCI18_009046 [Fusarium solani-melongenae]